MKHENGHETEIVAKSTKRSATGGVEFIIRCCGQHEHSVHIQNPGKYSVDELRRLKEDHQHRVADDHHNDVMAVKFLADREPEAAECDHCK